MATTVVLVTLHILGVGLVVGAVFATLLFVLRSSNDLQNLNTHLLARKLGTIGAGLAILTGIILAYRYKIPLLGNWSFDTKLILIAIDGLIANFAFRPKLEAAISSGKTDDLRGKLLGWAWLSVVIIVAIVAISVYRGKLHG